MEGEKGEVQRCSPRVTEYQDADQRSQLWKKEEAMLWALSLCPTVLPEVSAYKTVVPIIWCSDFSWELQLKPSQLGKKQGKKEKRKKTWSLDAFPTSSQISPHPGPPRVISRLQKKQELCQITEPNSCRPSEWAGMASWLLIHTPRGRQS